MSLKAFLLEVAIGLKRDEKYADSVLALLAQPGRLRCSMIACVIVHRCCIQEPK